MDLIGEVSEVHRRKRDVLPRVLYGGLVDEPGFSCQSRVLWTTCPGFTVLPLDC